MKGGHQSFLRIFLPVTSGILAGTSQVTTNFPKLGIFIAMLLYWSYQISDSSHCLLTSSWSKTVIDNQSSMLLGMMCPILTMADEYGHSWSVNEVITRLIIIVPLYPLSICIYVYMKQTTNVYSDHITRC